MATKLADGRSVKLTEHDIEAINAGVEDPASTDHTDAWRSAYIERFTVAKTCPACNEPLIAEEVAAHSLIHVSDGVRPIAAAYHDLTDNQKAELKAYIETW